MSGPRSRRSASPTKPPKPCVPRKPRRSCRAGSGRPRRAPRRGRRRAWPRLSDPSTPPDAPRTSRRQSSSPPQPGREARRGKIGGSPLARDQAHVQPCQHRAQHPERDDRPEVRQCFEYAVPSTPPVGIGQNCMQDALEPAGRIRQAMYVAARQLELRGKPSLLLEDAIVVGIGIGTLRCNCSSSRLMVPPLPLA